ncbi:MAG: hypothetical protein Q7S27_02495 [Nanoarchaeota archaeon]|nr:hypothetical protein [Nanoarchaeota archaeon]
MENIEKYFEKFPWLENMLKDTTSIHEEAARHELVDKVLEEYHYSGYDGSCYRKEEMYAVRNGQLKPIKIQRAYTSIENMTRRIEEESPGEPLRSVLKGDEEAILILCSGHSWGQFFKDVTIYTLPTGEKINKFLKTST